MRMMPEIGARAREEVERLGALGGVSVWRYAVQSGLHRNQYAIFDLGNATIRHLVLMARGGADILYILIGKRGDRMELPVEPIEEIGIRTYNEVERLAKKQNIAKKKVMKKIGAGERTEYGWRKGVLPSALFLVRLHYIGADITYILTGSTRNPSAAKMEEN